MDPCWRRVGTDKDKLSARRGTSHLRHSGLCRNQNSELINKNSDWLCFIWSLPDWPKELKSRSHHLSDSVLWDFTLFGLVQVTVSIWSTLANADSGRRSMELLGNPLNILMSPLVYHIFLWNSAFFPTDSTNYIFQDSTWSSSKYLVHDNKQDEWGWEPCH